MQTNRFTIVGESLSLFLPEIIEGFTSQYRNAIIRKHGSIVIIAIEEFFFRINSNLLTVIVVNTQDNNNYTIEILSGGGSQGLLGISLGAERKSVSTAMALINESCEKYSLSIKDQE
jgi:hypothetical protein